MTRQQPNFAVLTAVFLWSLVGNSAQASHITTVIEHNFNGSSTTGLSGTSVDGVGTGTWVAGGGWNADGSLDSGNVGGNNHAFLSFMVDADTTYQLSLDLTSLSTEAETPSGYNADGADWFAIGFTSTDDLTGPTNPTGGWQHRTDLLSPLLIHRVSVNDGTNGFGLGTMVTAEFDASAYVGQTIYAGMANYNSARGTVDDFKLVAIQVPEPSTLALLVLGLMGIGARKRWRIKI